MALVDLYGGLRGGDWSGLDLGGIMEQAFLDAFGDPKLAAIIKELKAARAEFHADLICISKSGCLCAEPCEVCYLDRGTDKPDEMDLARDRLIADDEES